MRGPSLTARGVAQIRDRLDRPHSRDGDARAAHGLARSLRTPIPLHRGRTLPRYVAARTRFFDDQVLHAIARGEGQIVILGAGYDDRASRFRTPGVRFVEVDHPATQHDKRARLRRLDTASDDVTFLPVDVATGDLAGLLADTLDHHVPTLVLCEGLIPYLPANAVDRLLEQAARSPGSPTQLAVELPIRPTTPIGRLALGALGIATGLGGEPIRTVFDDDRAAQLALAQAGWRIETWRSGRELSVPAVAGSIAYVTATAHS